MPNNLHNTIDNKLNNLKNISFGVYDDLISDVNTSIYDIGNLISNPRRWKRKTWIFVGVYRPDLYVGFAIVDAGYLAKAFCYAYFPKENLKYENGVDLPFGFSKNFSADLRNKWKLKNYEFIPDADNLIFKFKGKKFNLNVTVKNNNNGLSFICPSKGKNRPFHFTYKNLCLPCKIDFNTKEKSCIDDNVFAGIDFSKGYPPHNTTWNWLSFLGHNQNHEPVGINLVNNFNDNIENFMWIGNDRIPLGDVQFNFSKPLESNPWLINNNSKNLSLSMNPIGFRKENIDIKYIKSKFVQVFGPISGEINIDGFNHKLFGSGVIEDHHAKW